MAFEAKDQKVLGKQLAVQSLCLPFTILGNATPASVAITRDDPALLFVKTEGVDQITVAGGALDTGEAVPSYAASVDANGTFGVLVKLNESVAKVVGARLCSRSSTEIVACDLVGTGLSANGNKIALNVDSAVALNAANTLDAFLEVLWIAAE